MTDITKTKPMYVAVKAVVVKDDKILLLLKSDADNKFWDLPGGRIDYGESPIEALKRELQEEIPNLKTYVIRKLLGTRKKTAALKDGYELFLSYFLVDTDNNANLQLSDEHDRYQFFNLQELQEIAEPLGAVYSQLLKRAIEVNSTDELSENSIII